MVECCKLSFLTKCICTICSEYGYIHCYISTVNLTKIWMELHLHICICIYNNTYIQDISHFLKQNDQHKSRTPNVRVMEITFIEK